MAPGEVNSPAALLAASSAGYLDAHRELARRAYAMAAQSPGDWEEAMKEGILFARMANAHPERTVGDVGLLLVGLSQFSDALRGVGLDAEADGFEGECVALIDRMADEGAACSDFDARDYAANELNDIADRTSPAVLEAAKRYRKLWGEWERVDATE